MKIAGIDEVGRGALAGPVFLGMVILGDDFPVFTASYNMAGWSNKHSNFRQVRDSKKLSLKSRNAVYELIKKTNIQYYLLSASAALIDEYGIGVCLSHMVIIYTNLAHDCRIIIDGKIKILDKHNPELINKLKKENKLKLKLPYHPCLTDPNNCKILVERENKADDKYLSIALASVMAKVTRDELMQLYDQIYPVYNWAQNKGYGTLAHRLAIAQNPSNKLLRKTFLRKIIPQN
jgi:ribonuclease HII